MRSEILAGLILGLTLAGPVLAAETEESAKAKCAQYAKEDDIPQAEMADYMKDCIGSLMDMNTESNESQEKAD